jgi:hypothetical protein
MFACWCPLLPLQLGKAAFKMFQVKVKLIQGNCEVWSFIIEVPVSSEFMPFSFVLFAISVAFYVGLLQGFSGKVST